MVAENLYGFPVGRSTGGVWISLVWLRMLGSREEDIPVSYTHLTLPTIYSV